MLCQRCKREPATVHLTRIVDGVKTEEYLCGECARQTNEWEMVMEPEFSIHDLLGALLGEPMAPGKRPAAPVQTHCPNCGLTYDDFRQTGMLGCEQCYQAFAAQLDGILRRIHGSVRHSGKVPRRAGRGLMRQRELEQLRRQLEEAVQKEEFEKAAALRDRIRELQNSSAKGGSGHGA